MVDGRRPDLDSHLTQARRENVEFLLESGCSMEQIADRLGIKYGTLRDLIKDWQAEE